MTGSSAAVVSPLRLPGFRRLWAGGLVNDLGDWMLLVALPVYVYQLTGSALVTSSVFVAELLAGLIASQVAGVLVDRWDRRRTLVIAGLVQAGLVLPLLLVDAAQDLWIVYVVAASQSALARLCAPAKAALIPSLVAPTQLAAANSASAVADNLARLVGSPVGGLVVQVAGLPGVVLIDALSYLLSSALIAGIRTPNVSGSTAPASHDPALDAPSTSFRAAWLDGLRVIGRDARLRAVIVIAALSQLAQGIFVVLFVVFVLERLGGSGGDVGLIRGVQAIGGVLGGVLVGWLGHRVSARRLIAWGFLGFGVISLVTWNLPALTTAVGFYAGLFIVVGIPGVAASTGLLTTVQSLAPPSHLGRVYATYETGAAILAAIGVVAAGALADAFGVLPILDVQAGIYLVCGVLALITLREPVRAPAPATSTSPG